MSEAENFLVEALRRLGTKPSSNERADKKAFSEKLSAALAPAFAAELRRRGFISARPAPPGLYGTSGAERRMAGGIGAKKVDVTCATEESGLLLAASIKTINFVDASSKNYQKNLVNRRGDMLFEAVTLHRRFPYAVLAGFFIFDEGAANDGTSGRKSTFHNAHQAFRLFTGRTSPTGRDEQFERMYIGLHRIARKAPVLEFYEAGTSEKMVPLPEIFDDLIELIAERNFDLYESVGGSIRLRGRAKKS